LFPRDRTHTRDVFNALSQSHPGAFGGSSANYECFWLFICWKSALSSAKSTINRGDGSCWRAWHCSKGVWPLPRSALSSGAAECCCCFWKVSIIPLVVLLNLFVVSFVLFMWNHMLLWIFSLLLFHTGNSRTFS
jgi:hypothetical protein